MLRSSMAIAGLVLMSGPTGANSQIQNYQSQGNLEVTHALSCIPIDQVKSDYTPADLYPAVAKCLKQKKFDDGFALYAIAGVYGRYDTLRVADRTAHQAISVLQMVAFADVRDALGDGMKASGSKVMSNPSDKAAFCAKLLKIGPPSYFPKYMIQHGMGSFMGSGQNSLVKDFKSDEGFKSALSSYMHCDFN